MIGTASPYSNDLLIYPLAKLTDTQKDLAHFLIVAANSLDYIWFVENHLRIHIQLQLIPS